MQDCINTFTIVLSALGVMISIFGLAISIIYLINIFEVRRTQDTIKQQFDEIQKAKEAIINSCVAFPVDGSQYIEGADVIKSLREQYCCDDWTAIKIYQKQNK